MVVPAEDFSFSLFVFFAFGELMVFYRFLLCNIHDAKNQKWC